MPVIKEIVSYSTDPHLDVLFCALKQCQGGQFVWQRHVLSEHFQAVSQLCPPIPKQEKKKKKKLI